MKTRYKLRLHGRPTGAIGIFHDFEVEVVLDGVNHSREEIRLKAYEKADHIHGMDILEALSYTTGLPDGIRDKNKQQRILS